jgi:hypothetical protein
MSERVQTPRMNTPQGQYNSIVPIGLSMRINSRYGFERRAHLGSLSSMLGGGDAVSLTTSVEAFDGSGGNEVVELHRWDVFDDHAARPIEDGCRLKCLGLGVLRSRLELRRSLPSSTGNRLESFLPGQAHGPSAMRRVAPFIFRASSNRLLVPGLIQK